MTQFCEFETGSHRAYNPLWHFELASSSGELETALLAIDLTLFGLDLAFALARKASAFFATVQEVLHVTLFIVFFAIWIGTVLLWVFEKLKVIRPPLKERYDAASPELMCTSSIRRRWYFCSFWRESSSSRRSSRSWLRKFMGRDGQKAYNFELSLISVSRRQI